MEEFPFGRAGEDAYYRAIVYLKDLPLEEVLAYQKDPDQLFRDLNLDQLVLLAGEYSNVKNALSLAIGKKLDQGENPDVESLIY